MADNIDYEYENEDSIDNNLKCGICNDPFIDPVVTPCHHSYCWLCLDRWFQTSKSTCPACRKIISRLNTIPVTLLSFLSMLDQLLVECKLCKQSKIQRGNFEDHIDKICPKKIVNCSASDINCPWTGLREELQTHLSTCIYESTRSLLETNNNENQQKVEKPVKRKWDFDLNTLKYISIFEFF
jgi:hypothetical protein